MLLWKCFEPKFADGGVRRGTTIREEAGAWRRVSLQVAGSRLQQVTVCLRSCHIVGGKTETQTHGDDVGTVQSFRTQPIRTPRVRLRVLPRHSRTIGSRLVFRAFLDVGQTEWLID